jgi:hypothetical protein
MGGVKLCCRAVHAIFRVFNHHQITPPEPQATINQKQASAIPMIVILSLRIRTIAM